MLRFFQRQKKSEPHPITFTYCGNPTGELYEQIKELSKSVEDGIVPIYTKKIQAFVQVVIEFKANYWVVDWLMEFARTAELPASERLAAGMAGRKIQELAKAGQTAWIRVDGITSKNVAAGTLPDEGAVTNDNDTNPLESRKGPHETQAIDPL